MKISSNSILSPGRAPDPPNSLSLSRRLRNSGSIKGGASPAMFPTTAKKRGSFENPEPSSPKVTCIGQVRVKSKKKQAKKLRTFSRKHNAGEVSFRKAEHPLNEASSKTQSHHESFNLGSTATQNPNQECSPAQRSWVHFPVTICDALRALSDFSCLFPCRKEEKMVTMEEGSRQGSCGAVFARWLVAVQDGDGGAERDIELVVGEEEGESVFKKPRRHVFEDLEIINDRIEGQKDESRLSICIPPKNALLLMRCRSDPTKMEALTNRSWEPNLDKNEEEDEEFVDQIKDETVGFKERQENLENEAQNQKSMNLEQDEANQNQDHENLQQYEAVQDQEQENVQQYEAGQHQEQVNVQDEANQDQAQENVRQDEVDQHQEQDNVRQDEVDQDQEQEQDNEVDQDQDQEQEQEQENVQQDEVGQDQDKELTDDLYIGLLYDETVNQDFEIDEDNAVETEANELAMVTEFAEIAKSHEEEMVDNGVLESASEERERQKVLPECLLMMIYEPRLSMEVSKETWVCSTDFIKPHSNMRKPPPPPPVQAVVKTHDRDQSLVTGPSIATLNYSMMVGDGRGYQPARSSCSFPAAPSMATVTEQKLADAVGYEPFVLTRCKSEPTKTAAAKLLPESCVWENRKMERLSRVQISVGAAALGF